MKLKPLTLILWALSAAGTFALGWALKPQAAPSTVASATTVLVEPGRLTESRAGDAASLEARAKASGPLGAYLRNGNISSADMGIAIKDMMQENDPLKRASLFTSLLEQLTPENAKSAFQALRDQARGRRGGFGPGGGGDEMRLLLNAWGRIDGKNAIAEITALNAEAGDNGGRGRGPGGPGGRDGMFDIYSALTGWATEDATGAMDYVNTLEDERQKGMLTSSIVSGLMVKGIDEAVSFINSLPNDDRNSRGRYMEMVADEALEKGVASASKWVDGLSDDLKGGAMNRVADEYARENLTDAVAWVSKYAQEDFARGAVTEIAQRWADSDPQAVLDWADGLPPETQTRVMEEAFDQWTENDPLAASEYLAKMPSSPSKDSAVEGFATELARQDPESAAAWAGTIGDETLRMQTLSRVARDWMRADPAAVQQWLPQSGLPAETQQDLLQGGGRGPDFRGRGGRGR